jgi:hypothetical protein
VAATMASWASSAAPKPRSASSPTIRQMPVMPATTPNSLRTVAVSCRTSRTASRKVKIGEVELRMVARPASTIVSPQAIKVKGTTLLRQAWTRKLSHRPRSLGKAMPRRRMTSSRSKPAIRVRAAMKVTGGIVSTPTRMKV